MATGSPTVYLDDPDPSWTFTITSRNELEVDWDNPVVAIGPGDYEVNATWEGDAGTSRTLRVPLDGLTAGTKQLYLRVPNGTDIALGTVWVVARQ